ncbi:threonine/serine exporter family protein [Clostridium paridis]|uniref:Threonine/serine exporter family protein n=1 Tax=Clostridium paridis TaxID=2803863 RepID=A0A937FD97_9CLOT|nr:threonine/serine exporter family protein [Clostridium paridis]MBL4931118.1 threonine/serine exporter family protein [Clostridium paridis]
MDSNKILHVATYAGRIILENGGETYRVEETINRICHAFGMEDADSFVTPTGIMASAFHTERGTFSLVRRVRSRTVNLQKVHEVNDLSRNILLKNMTVLEVLDELKKIDKSKRYDNKTTIFFSALGAGAFSMLFGGNIKDFVAAFIIGLVIKYFSIVSSSLSINDFFTNSISGAITAIMALIFIKLNIASNLDMTIIGAIMLLVPGLAITNAIRDTIAGDFVSGLTRAAEAFLVAIAIAVGSGIVLSFWFKFYGGI